MDFLINRMDGMHHNEQNLISGAVCAVESTYPHFGKKSLHVKNCQAVARKVAVSSPSAKITWSAWVRPVTANPIRFAVSLVLNGVGENLSFMITYTTHQMD